MGEKFQSMSQISLENPSLPRWILAGAFVGIVIALLLIPPPYSTALFALMVVVPLAYALIHALPNRLLIAVGGVVIIGGCLWAIFGGLRGEMFTVEPPPSTKLAMLDAELAALPDGTTFPWSAPFTSAVAVGVVTVLCAVVAGFGAWRRQWRATLSLVTFGLMAGGAYAFRPGALDETGQGVALFVVGVAVFIGGSLLVWWLERRSPIIAPHIPQADADFDPDATQPATRPLIHWSPWIAASGVLAIIVLTAINALDTATVPAWVQVMLLVAGAGLLVGAFTRRRPLAAITVDAHWIILLGILLLAFALRVVELETLIHRYIDEVASIESLLELHADPSLQLLRPYEGVARFTRTYTVLQGWTVDALGPSLLALRLVSAFAGTLTVAALYLLARELFDRETALIAALVLATFPPHVHFSRTGINNVVDPLFGVLALAFLARGIRRTTPLRPRLADFALAGAMLGLTQVFYEGGRLLFPPLVLILALINWRALRWRGLAVLVGSAVLVGGPVYVTLLAGDFGLVPRLDGAGRDPVYWEAMFSVGPVEGLQAYWRRNLRFPLWHLVQRSDLSGFYGGQTALLLTVALPFFFLGLARALRGWWRFGGAMLLLWLAATVFGNSLMINVLESARYVVAFPALALLIALGVRLLGESAAALSTQRTAWGIMAGLALMLATVQGAYYLRVHVPYYLWQYRDATAVEDVYFRALDLPNNTHIHLVTDELVYGRELYVVLAYYERVNSQIFMTQTAPETLTYAYLDNRIPSRATAVFVPLHEVDLLAYLRGYDGWEQISRSPYDIPHTLNYWLFLDAE